MSHFAVMLYSLGAAAVFALVQMIYTKQEKIDLYLMAVVGVLFLGGGVATHILLEPTA